MKRREFIKTSAAASALAGLGPAALSASAAEPLSGKGSEYYELRVYHMRSSANRGLLDSYLSKALIPGLNRLGIKPVGVFGQQDRTGKPGTTEVTDPLAVLMLIPYSSIQAFAQCGWRLYADPEYHSAGAEFLGSPKASPAFERIDSWLMVAFAGMPRLELPAFCRENKPRMFELRTYESHSELKAIRKVEMFNRGEIDLMREVKLGPIFYGQTLIGSDLPHLTYMLSAENQEAHKEHWDAFRVHPKWDKMKNDPQYADTVSKITNRFLVPAPYSQI
jgi:hypothetical protein